MPWTNHTSQSLKVGACLDTAQIGDYTSMVEETHSTMKKSAMRRGSRHAVTAIPFLPALLLTLGGCYLPPGEQPGYGYGYAQPGYASVAPAGVYGENAEIFQGYSYNEGSPTMIVEGAPMPLIFFGGSWGYYDGERRFHRAPDPVWRQLESRHPQGYGVRPYASPEGPRYQGYQRPPENRYGGAAPMPPQHNFAPAAQPRQEFVPGARPQHGFVPVAQPVPQAAPPQRGFVPAAQPVPRPMPAAQPQPQPQRHEERHCPNGQPRC